MKKFLFFLFTLLVCRQARAQHDPVLDSLPDYDALFNDFAHFLDSITAPRSFKLVNIGYSTARFEYQTSRNTLSEKRKGLLTPALAYYDKNGLGISVVGSLLLEEKKPLLYQTAATASYDYLKNRRLMTGVSYTYFFTKDSLPFYTSPLNHQVYSYFSYRHWWLKPMVAAAYGWGSVTSVESRKEKLKLFKKGPPVTTTTTTRTVEAISDLSVTASVKHDFYWLHVLRKNDYIRLTPQVVATGGTQHYGLNQTNNLYVSEKHSDASVLYNTENNFVASRSQFQLLSLSARLRAEYSRGIFFLQPQLLFDYYIPNGPEKLSAAVLVNAGILF